MEPVVGLEPTTYWLQVSCAANYAILAFFFVYFLCIYYTKKFLENQLYQSKKDRKNPYWNLNKTYFICADYNESPYTTDLLFIYHRFGSSINMDFPLIFTFCFSSPDRRFGAHALFSSYKISSIQLKKSTSLQSIISLPKITYSFRSRGAHTYLFAWGRDS